MPLNTSAVGSVFNHITEVRPLCKKPNIKKYDIYNVHDKNYKWSNCEEQFVTNKAGMYSIKMHLLNLKRGQETLSQQKKLSVEINYY